MEIVNSTTTYLGSMGGLASWLPMCLFLMGGIFLITFLLSKTLRWSLIGAGISGLGFVVFEISKYISKENVAGNGIPLGWYGYIVAFIAISIIVGQILKHTKWGKKLDAEIDKK